MGRVAPGVGHPAAGAVLGFHVLQMDVHGELWEKVGCCDGGFSYTRVLHPAAPFRAV